MLEGKDFILRAVRESELEELFELVRTQDFARNLLKASFSDQKLQEKFYDTGFWEEGEGIILILKKKRIAGMIEYIQAAPFEGLNLSLCLFKERDRGQGLMSEALSLFSTYLFETKKIQRLQVLIPDYNKAAIRVVQKCCFQFEGIARQAMFYKGAYRDLCLYSLLRRDIRPLA